ncbi:MAG TPA: plasmid maintenance system killer [Lentisphaeria bacterium]|nr:MAG: plasmid maintenance system killer [Lentisphaerae bacterium GWF2_50_93]HCE44547.1 plasmid maintenance system killer [Lentisphaeria bacterium]
MIKSFADKETKKIYNLEFSKGLPPDVQQTALMKLKNISYAININDLRVPPSNHLEVLKGDRKGKHSIRINSKWRICFRWVDGSAYDVEIVDYH